MLGRIFTVGGYTLLSRLTGFARDIMLAAILGAGPVADAFFVALRLPNHFRAIFAESTRRIDEEGCAHRAEAVGLDKDRFLEKLRSPETEERLEHSARKAYSEGAFGVPTFVVGDETFWGNDRLVLVRHHLDELSGRA